MSCSVPGVANVEVNPRGGATQKVRFALPAGEYELVCASAMAAAGDSMGGGMGGGVPRTAAVFVVR